MLFSKNYGFSLKPFLNSCSCTYFHEDNGISKNNLSEFEMFQNRFDCPLFNID